MDFRYLVTYDADAILEFEQVKGRDLRKAVFAVVDKLRRLGPELELPHAKTLKGEAGLLELRPRQGKVHIRPIYDRFADDYVILAFAVLSDKRDFDKAVKHAHTRRSRYRA